MRVLGCAALVLAALAVTDPPAAQAQGIYIGPGGVQVDPTPRPRGGDIIIRERGEVGRGEAIGIARRQGLVDVDSVSRTGRRWIVEGVDRRGRDRQVVINARTGEVLRYN